MSLISLPFMLLVTASCVLYYLAPKQWRWCILLLANVIFYVAASQALIIFLIGSILSVYIGGLAINKQIKLQKATIKSLEKDQKKAYKAMMKKRKQLILIVVLAINIGILCYLKYYGFFAGNLNAINALLHVNVNIAVKKFVLPLGISYYTLMAISYMVDVYRGKYEASPQLGKVALYLSFFPQMTEGPISRFDQLADQLYAGNEFDIIKFKSGLYLILWGLFKKLVIADRAALYVNPVFSGMHGGFTAFLAVALYTLQIYAEFSGAMDIVRGIGYLFGVHMEKNFEQPFFSKSIAEFWRRWHRTLGTWLKDYVFYSISLSKMNMNLNRSVKKHMKGNFGRFILSAFPLFFVWFFNGFWHGASWKYIVYGLYYYLIMMMGLLLAPVFTKIKDTWHLHKQRKGYRLFCILRTVLIVFGGMLIFRAHSLDDALQMLLRIFTMQETDILAHGLTLVDFGILIWGLVLMFIIAGLKERRVNLFALFDQKSLLLRYGIILIIGVSIIVFGIYGHGYQASDFIYGEF